MTARPEAVAAADWWADRLARHARHETGDAGSTAFATAGTAMVERHWTPEQIEAFRFALAEQIEQHVSKYDWRPDEPDFGSYMRAIRVYYGPDPVLGDAAEQAGFPLRILDLPMKTVMWINPGIVKVAEGHSVQPAVIWRADA